MAHLGSARQGARGRVVAADKEAASYEAMEEFRIEPARRFRLIAEPVE